MNYSFSTKVGLLAYTVLFYCSFEGMSSLRRNDVSAAPLRLLNEKTKQAIARYLDSGKILLSEERLHRDWRGIAEYTDLDTSVIRCTKISYTEHCLHLWSKNGGLIANLWEALEKMDRFDVIDGTICYIYEDYDAFKQDECSGLQPVLPPLENIHPTIAEFDANILTTDDQHNLNHGGALQFYDALVLFSDEDLEFVDMMVQKLEGQYKLKLCLKDRDLLGGLSFESSVLLKLIEERCARVIVVLSPAFLQSNANKFLTRFAHALSIDQQRRILIPCMYKPCTKPLEITYCHSLDYFRTKGFWDYWQKLADSITYNHNLASHSGPIIREISSTNNSEIMAEKMLNRNQRHVSRVVTRDRRKKENYISKAITEVPVESSTESPYAATSQESDSLNSLIENEFGGSSNSHKSRTPTSQTLSNASLSLSSSKNLLVWLKDVLKIKKKRCKTT